MSDRKCAVCDKGEKLSKCARCQKVFYCGREHQIEHWATHKRECNKQQENTQNGKKIEQKPKKNEEEEYIDQNAVEQISQTIEEMIAEGGGLKATKIFDFPKEHLSVCGNHQKGELKTMIHPLNNMAGLHRYDAPIYSFDTDEEMEVEDFAVLGEVWEVGVDKYNGRFIVFGNGLKLTNTSQIKRSMSKYGVGMFLKDKIIVGKYEGKEDEEIIEFPGEEEFKYTVVESNLHIGENLIVKPGGYIDSYAIVHGPLTYHGIDIGADGGVHYSGSAYKQEGDPGNTHYFELCIASLIKEIPS